jgi:glycosyltransferase involved in cell wall biosynthesis
MIVKDEEHCIEDCLKNVKGCIDAVVIVDTGSTDKTKSIIENYCSDNALPCKIIDDPWRSDFGYSRTRALKEAVLFAQQHNTAFAKYKKLGLLEPKEYKKFTKCNTTYYALFMDADNRLYTNGGKEDYKLDKKKLVADIINIKMRQSSAHYDYVWMVKLDLYNHKRWKWFDPLHEYIAPEREWTPGKQTIEEGYIVSGRFGSRSKNPYKYLDDAHVFRKALKRDPFNERFMYYYSQSLRDAGELKEALEAFKRRGEVKGYIGEQYVALVEAGKIQKALEPNEPSKFIQLFLQAINVEPKRLEAPYHICNYYRLTDQFNLGYYTCVAFANIPYPTNALFIDNEIHMWQFYDELAICAFYAGDKALCKELSLRALKYDKIPIDQRKRIENNTKFS